MPKDFDLLDMDYVNTASTTDCTGLIPAAPVSKAEMEAYEELIYLYTEKYKESGSDYHFNKINKYLSILSKDKYYDKCKGKLKEKLNEISKKHLALVKLV